MNDERATAILDALDTLIDNGIATDELGDAIDACESGIDDATRAAVRNAIRNIERDYTLNGDTTHAIGVIADAHGIA